MPRAILEEEDDNDGFTNEDGELNILDDISTDEPVESFYRQELKKMTSGLDDPFESLSYGVLDTKTKRRVNRELKKKLEGKSGAKSKYIDIEVISGYTIYGLARPPYNLNHLVQLSVENDTHYACIVTKATNIVGLGYKWVETNKVKDTRLQIEDDEDKILKLARKLQRVQDGIDEWFEDLNLEDDIGETLYKVWVDVESSGNGYIEVGRNRNGSIGYLGHIPSATMRVRAKRDGFVQLVYSAAGSMTGLASNDRPVFFRNFGDKTTPDLFGKDTSPNEIIHIKKYTPKTTYYGVPDIIAAMSSVAGEKFSSEYNLDYFENKAVPRYALIVKGAKLSTQAERRILEYFRKEVKGKHHGTLYIPVPAHMGSNVDVKLEPIENKVQDASFEKYRAGNRESIAMVHRVPLSKLGVGKGVAAAREDDKSFKLQTVQPPQRALAKKLNRIIKTVTDLYKLQFEEYDLIDEETRSRIHDRYIRTGVENPDEVRAELGRAPRKGGNVYVPLAQQIEAQTELALAQAGLADSQKSLTGTQEELAPAQAEAQVAAAKAKAAAPANAGAGSTGGSRGPARKTTDGSPKNKQQTTTPAAQTPQGKGTRGSARDKGAASK